MRALLSYFMLCQWHSFAIFLPKWLTREEKMEAWPSQNEEFSRKLVRKILSKKIIFSFYWCYLTESFKCNQSYHKYFYWWKSSNWIIKIINLKKLVVPYKHDITFEQWWFSFGRCSSEFQEPIYLCLLTCNVVII